MNNLTKYFGGVAILFVTFMSIIRFIYNLGKKDKGNEIKEKNANERYRKIKSINKSKTWISRLSDDELNKLLRRKIEYVTIDEFCNNADLIQLGEGEKLSRQNMEKIALYNCECVNDQFTCKRYEL